MIKAVKYVDEIEGIMYSTMEERKLETPKYIMYRIIGSDAIFKEGVMFKLNGKKYKVKKYDILNDVGCFDHYAEKYWRIED